MMNDNFYTAEPGSLSIDATTRDESGFVDCAYCGADVPNTTPASASDGDWWAIEAAHHLPTCEWVETRAHQLGCCSECFSIHGHADDCPDGKS